jgi:radical SAM superfamily enzyme YgiQ (UPF0313 family)
MLADDRRAWPVVYEVHVMKVTLVVPPFSASERTEEARIRRGKLRPLPPLGLGYLAAALEAHGHTVTLVDSQARQLALAEAVDIIFAEAPDLVGISSFTVLADVSYALAAAVKARDPDKVVAIGGPHATAFHEAILEECPGVDFVVPGEAEASFTGLVDCLAAGSSLDTVPGIIFRDGSGVSTATPRAELVRDLDTLGCPARHIYDNALYVPLPNQSRRRPATTVMTSRGCPWAQCRFCYQGGKYGSPYRRRSPDNVIEELRRLVRDIGFREVIFWDDNFCVNEQWVDRFCGLLDRERLDLTWTVQGRVNTVTRTMLQRIAASGCYNIFFGFESGDQELLDLIDKGITLDQSRTAVAWANEAGLEIRGAFMFGLPTETPAMAEKTIRFACELDVDYVVFSPYHVQRGTPIEALALREGRLVETKEETFNWNHPSYVPKAYSGPAELAEVVRSAYRRFYLRPRYIARALWRARDPVILRNNFRAFLHWWEMTRPGKSRA